jgi:gas vesicle protein
MSYAGPAGRTKRASTIEPLRVESGSRSGVGRRGGYAPRGASSNRSSAYFAAGIAVGIAVGAGVAILFAPQSGADTRRQIARRGRRIGRRGRDAWGDLAYELKSAAKRRRKAWRDRRERRREERDERDERED